MTRPLRIEYSGAVYHVTSRGNGRKPIFKDDRDRVELLDILGEVNDRFHWLCHAYCLMNNHYHLIIETPDGNLSKGMRQLNGVYTMRFNRRHDSIGHLFQGRYKAILLQKESHLLTVCRYVVLNPIRAKRVKSPEQWEWSSYRGTIGLGKPYPCFTTDWILGQFGAKRREAKEKYKAFVLDGIGQQTIWGDVKGQSTLGDGNFVARLVDYVKGHNQVKEFPRSLRHMNRPTLEEIFRNTKERREKRNNGIFRAIELWGYSQREVADYLGFHYSTVSRLLKQFKLGMSKLKT